MTEPQPTVEQRAWAEYLDWTRGAADGQYEVTEEKAWARLQGALIALRLRPYTLRPQPHSPLSDDPVPRA